MPPIVTSAEIERPAAEVFAYATDPTRFSQWQKGVVDGHMDGPADGTQPPTVGAKCVTTRRIGGASRPSTSELVHIDPPRTWGVRGLRRLLPALAEAKGTPPGPAQAGAPGLTARQQAGVSPRPPTRKGRAERVPAAGTCAVVMP